MRQGLCAAALNQATAKMGHCADSRNVSPRKFGATNRRQTSDWNLISGAATPWRAGTRIDPRWVIPRARTLRPTPGNEPQDRKIS